MAEPVIFRISNLKRPFAVLDLKEDCGKFGEIGEFWINKTRSDAFVVYRNSELDVQALLDYFHGRKWPLPHGLHLICSRTSLEAMKLFKLGIDHGGKFDSFKITQTKPHLYFLPR
jgi:hypothetical protein